MDLPVCALACSGAVVHLCARAATHLAGAKPGAEAEGADALVGLLGDGVEDRGQGRLFRLAMEEVGLEHVQKHVAHEISVVHHVAESKIAPDPPAEDHPAVGEVGVHHLAIEGAGVARKPGVGFGIALL